VENLGLILKKELAGSQVLAWFPGFADAVLFCSKFKNGESQSETLLIWAKKPRMDLCFPFEFTEEK